MAVGVSYVPLGRECLAMAAMLDDTRSIAGSDCAMFLQCANKLLPLWEFHGIASSKEPGRAPSCVTVTSAPL